MDLTLRHLSTLADYEAAVELQYQTWGRDFAGCVPAAILMVSQRIGGISAGAFSADGRMAGCVFGMTGIRDGALVHWSDILAVSKEFRGMGLGKRLKWFQREELLKRGVRTMFWTYDPLQALNANLNLNTLRARPVEYVVNMYGDTGSDLHAGLGTDRFIVRWDLDAADVAATADGRVGASDRAPDAPIVNARIENGKPVPEIAELPDAPSILIEIPVSIDEEKRVSGDAGMRWRESTRRAFEHYLGRGRTVTGFHELAGGRRVYSLERRTQ
jgi:predicted GNAT superfamily acetyltransferase